MTEQRGNWSSSMGFILAATGSAIGLGNLWKFPFITWENDGGAFVLVYLICIAAVGLPIMMAELLIGRKTQKSAVGALKEAVGPNEGNDGGLLESDELSFVKAGELKRGSKYEVN